MAFINTPELTHFTLPRPAPNLQHLNFHRCNLSHIRDFPYLPALTSLYITGSARLNSLEGLHPNTQLTHLGIGSCGFTSLNSLPNLAHIRHLALPYNHIDSFERLASCPHLSSLNISDCAIASLEDLPLMPSLHRLMIRRNSMLTNLNGIENFPNLTNQLDASNCSINNIDALIQALPANLSHLDLQNNQLERLPENFVEAASAHANQYQGRNPIEIFLGNNPLPTQTYLQFISDDLFLYFILTFLNTAKLCGMSEKLNRKSFDKYL